MKIALLVVGLVLIVFGLHWIGQGTGLFAWPGNPMMTGKPVWTYIGSGAALAGLAAVWLSRRRAG